MNDRIKSEWSLLKELVSGMDGEEYDGQRITWHLSSSPALPDSLWLKDVAAYFHADTDVPPHVHFGRRPTGGTWTGPSPVPLLTWSLEQKSERDAFAWQFREVSQPDDPFQPVNIFQSENDGPLSSETLSSDRLAKRIRDRLIQHYKDYEKSFK